MDCVSNLDIFGDIKVPKECSDECSHKFSVQMFGFIKNSISAATSIIGRRYSFPHLAEIASTEYLLPLTHMSNLLLWSILCQSKN